MSCQGKNMLFIKNFKKFKKRKINHLVISKWESFVKLWETRFLSYTRLEEYNVSTKLFRNMFLLQPKLKERFSLIVASLCVLHVSIMFAVNFICPLSLLDARKLLCKSVWQLINLSVELCAFWSVCGVLGAWWILVKCLE